MAAFNPSHLSRVALIKNPSYQKNGLKSYVHLLQKYNFGPTLDGPFKTITKAHQHGSQAVMQKLDKAAGGRVLTKTDANGNTGEVPAEDVQHDSMYLAPVSIGMPAQTLKLDLDTGSSDLWVMSTEMSPTIQAQVKASGHTVFDASKSSTWQASPGETWKIQYGDGSTASGDVGTDTVTIGGLTVKNQAVERASQLANSFKTGAGDGLLGLAWDSINTVKPKPVQTLVGNMISQQDIPNDAELFTAYLGCWKDANSSSQDGSFYTFGQIDQAVVQASGQNINWAPVDNSQGFWQFQSSCASVNGKTINRAGNTAIADTGTTLALVDDATCEAIYAAIPGAKQDYAQQGWVFPASTTTDQLPIVQFAVGNNLFTVQKEDLAFASAGPGMVYGGIQSRGTMNFDILGDTFLKSIYAIFDQGNKRFGCVQRAAPAASGSQS